MRVIKCSSPAGDGTDVGVGGQSVFLFPGRRSRRSKRSPAARTWSLTSNTDRGTSGSASATFEAVTPLASRTYAAPLGEVLVDDDPLDQPEPGRHAEARLQPGRLLGTAGDEHRGGQDGRPG